MVNSARQVNLYTVSEAVNRMTNGSFQVAAKGTVDVNLDVTPVQGDFDIRQMIVNAPTANVDATLKIYKDSISAPNLLFDGHMMNRDGDGSIRIPNGEIATTKFIVLVEGGSGDVFALLRHN